MCIGEEIVADLLVIRAAAEVKEVDCDFVSSDGNFFDTVIDSDCGNVLLYEPALAITLDDTGFAGLLVTYGDKLEQNLIALHGLCLNDYSSFINK